MLYFFYEDFVYKSDRYSLVYFCFTSLLKFKSLLLHGKIDSKILSFWILFDFVYKLEFSIEFLIGINRSPNILFVSTFENGFIILFNKILTKHFINIEFKCVYYFCDYFLIKIILFLIFIFFN